MEYRRAAARHSAAFTRTEFVVAVVIVLMLTAIMYPKMRSARDYAGWMNCASSVKQLGLAIAQYEQDNDIGLPPATAGGVSWRRLVSTHARPTQKCVCPNNPARTLPDAEHDGSFRSYAVNASSGGKNGIGGPFNTAHPTIRANKIAEPSTTIFLVESTSALASFDPLRPTLFAQPTGTTVGHLFDCYNLQTAVLYGDFHVKQELLDRLKTDEAPNPWTVDGSAFSSSDKVVAKKTIDFAATQAPWDPYR